MKKRFVGIPSSRTPITLLSQLSDIENSLSHFPDFAKNRSQFNDQLAIFESLKDQSEALARRVFKNL